MADPHNNRTLVLYERMLVLYEAGRVRGRRSRERMGTTNTTSAGGAAVTDPQRPFEATEVGVGIAIALPAALLRRRGVVVTATLMSKAAPVYPPEKRNFRINIITATVTVNAHQSLIMTPSELASSVVVPLARPNLGPARDRCYRTLVLPTRIGNDARQRRRGGQAGRTELSASRCIVPSARSQDPGQLPLTPVWVL